MKAAAYTLGCKVNQYDTQAMLELLRAAGYEIVPFHEKADVYIVNSCTVTGTADKKTRQMAGRAEQSNPDGLVVITGCLAQRAGEELLSLPGVRAVVGTSGRADIVRIVEMARQGKVNAVAANTAFEELSVSSSGDMTRGYIKIQEGCSRYCSYCIIPYVRGAERSRPMENALSEARTLSAAGVREVVLTGINISSYCDRGRDIADLAGCIGETEGISRIRFGSLEPGLLTPGFIGRLTKIKKLCPHFHVSLQSGSNSVLKRMNRTYTVDEYARVVALLRRSFDNPAITTDVITGFPGETRDEFAQTKAFVRRMAFARLHVFPYSERAGTRAAVMQGAVPAALRRERANELIAAGRETEHAYASSFLGKKEEVLFERSIGGGFSEGHTTRYIKVRARALPNELKIILLKTQKNDILTGETLEG